MQPRIDPDRAALEIAHRLLRTPMTLEQMLGSRPLSLILMNVARRHMQRRNVFDTKRLQANDYQESQ